MVFAGLLYRGLRHNSILPIQWNCLADACHYDVGDFQWNTNLHRIGNLYTITANGTETGLQDRRWNVAYFHDCYGVCHEHC